MVRVLYLNVHDENYPRNRRIRQYLADNGHEVVVVKREDTEYFVLQSLNLLRSGLRIKGHFDIVMLSELGIQYAPVAKILSLHHRARLIVDAFVGMYETNVEDWGRVSARSLRGRLYRAFDLFAGMSSSALLSDTEIRASKLPRGAKTTVLSIPVGAPSWAVPTTVPPGASRRFLYYGNYIRLHGLDYVLAALVLVEGRFRPQVTLVGDGEDRASVEQKVRELGLESVVSFRPPVPEASLAQLISEHGAVLGIFGESPKARTVIANKVWQGLAAGRTVITRTSPALEELKPIVGDQLVMVDTDDPANLARELELFMEQKEVPYFPENSHALTDYADRSLERLNELIAG